MSATDELRRAVLKLMGATVAASDQAEMMTDAELGDCLLTGRWTTIEIHEAGCRLKARAAPSSDVEGER